MIYFIISMSFILGSVYTQSALASSGMSSYQKSVTIGSNSTENLVEAPSDASLQQTAQTNANYITFVVC